LTSSSPSRCGAGSRADDGVALVPATVASGAEAAAAGALAAPGLASSGRVSTRATVTGRVVATAGSTPGGTTRITWPTSITFGFVRLFQRIRSFQFWPVSRPIRISVSPDLTV
jgi:hypothetical protein